MTDERFNAAERVREREREREEWEGGIHGSNDAKVSTSAPTAEAS